MLHNKYVILLLGLASLSCSAMAQKKLAKPKAKVVRQEAETPAILMEDVLPATAKLIVVDSVVCDKADFMKHIPLAKECGRITSFNDFFGAAGRKRNGSFVYENDFGDKCFYNDSTKSGSMLLTAERIGGKWQAPRAIEEFGKDFEDVNYPYLMPDGVTLYFSAINKNNSLGGRDIYMTRLNSDSMRFYKPENIGLPYNSNANDYCCIIDDLNSLGWLVSDRFQTKGKVCVYTFVPSTERWTDGNANIPTRKLEALAKISSIKDTWTSKAAVDNAMRRIANLKSSSSAGDKQSGGIYFVVNDNTVYRSTSDFKSATGKQLYSKLAKLREMLGTDVKTLDILRQQYAKAKGRDKNAIVENIMILEKGNAEKAAQASELEKKIRNAENIK